jgi:hypothetical protein
MFISDVQNGRQPAKKTQKASFLSLSATFLAAKLLNMIIAHAHPWPYTMAVSQLEYPRQAFEAFGQLSSQRSF